MARLPVDYKITDIVLSTITKTTPPEEGAYQRITTLRASATYEYVGITTQVEYGTVLADIADLTTVTFQDGVAVGIEHEGVPSSSAIVDFVKSAINNQITTLRIVEEERSFNRESLASANREMSSYIAEQSKGDFSEEKSRFTPQFEGYKELQDWDTGIGTVGYNTIPQGK